MDRGENLTVDISASSKQKCWEPLVDVTLRQQALDIVHIIIERMQKPETVLSCAQKAKQQSHLFLWLDSSFSGFVGVALPFLYLMKVSPQPHLAETLHRYISLAVHHTHNNPFHSPSIFGGTSGIAWALSLCAQQDPRYAKAAQKLNQQVAHQVLHRTWSRQEPGVASKDYDTISGAAGILGYLVSIRQQEPIIQDAIHTLLEYLTWLSGEDGETHRQRWYTPPCFFTSPDYLEEYPDGYLNCGLAHGIPGPLVALILAWKNGYRLPGQYEAITSITRWLIEHHIDDQWGVNWPTVIGIEGEKQPNPARSAWCYGAPGVARALWLAGMFLNDSEACQVALDGLLAVFRRPLERRNIKSPTLCHGITGLLLISLHFAQECDHPILHEQLSILTRQVIDLYNPAFPLGFRDEELPGTFLDDPGLITGVSGVLLTLLAVSTPIEPDWDRALLLG